jgi:hypothetical protein
VPDQRRPGNMRITARLSIFSDFSRSLLKKIREPIKKWTVPLLMLLKLPTATTKSVTPKHCSVSLSDHNPDDQEIQRHFFNMYQQEFFPLIKVVPQKEASKIVRVATEMAPKDLRSVVAQNIINSISSIDKEQVKSLKSLTLQPDWSWHDIYTSVKLVKQEVTSQVRQSLGLEPERAILSHATFLMFHKTSEKQQHYRIDVAPLIAYNYNQSRHTVIFLPDYTTLPLKLKDMNSRNEMFDGKTSICVMEGLCRWSEHTEQYHLIFPLSSLRLMFLQSLKEQTDNLSGTTINTPQFEAFH